MKRFLITWTPLAYQSTEDLETFGDFQGEQGNMRQIFRVPVTFIHKVLSFPDFIVV